MHPETEKHLAEIIRSASGALSVRGGGTRGSLVDGTPMETCGLSGITLYEPGSLTLVVRAGTPLAEVEATLAAERQRLAFEPPDLRGLLGTEGTSTIGGVIAAGASGPRRIAVGAARDFLLGVRFVDGGGQVVANGGRVMKNVTGYDLVKLMAGSRGTLGVLTEVSLKVMPLPEAEATLLVDAPDAVRAVAVLSAALGSPYDVTGAGWSNGQAMVRIEGLALSVEYRAGRLAALLARHGTVGRAPDGVSLWQALRDVTAFAGQPGDVWRFSVKPSDAPAILLRLGGARVMLDWGGGLIWALLPEGTDARALAAPYAGHATLMRAGTETRARTPMLEPESPAVMRLSAGLRRMFDPRGILNPGLMAG
ncbi:MAG: glycolate oxidase subunit GlcE [Paracoccaceae bacterium]